jgi:hypothetical protein
MERFREFNRRGLRALLNRLTDAELETIELGYRILTRVADGAMELLADATITEQGDHS